jgi:cytochrome c biogenesis protein CcdA
MIVYAYVYILGILSVLSACTVIILPVLLSQIISKRKKLFTALLFSLGFSLSFATLGAITGLVGQAVVPNYEPYFLIFSAIITFIMALRFFGIISFNTPSSRIRFFPKNTFILGFVFGFVALSCISALLSAVFVFAISQGSILSSIIIFMVYSLGYSTPLIAASTIMEEDKITSFITRHRSKVDFISGVMLLFASSYLTLLYFGVILFT